MRSAKIKLAPSPLALRSMLLLALLLAGAALSGAALAASDAIVDCDRVETSLRSLDVPVEELPGDADDRFADTSPGSSGTTPILLLTTRAANLSREVFAALPIVVLDDDGEEIDTADEASPDIIRPVTEPRPFVDTPPMPEARLLHRLEETADTRQTLPRFQRQMYRTDI